MSLGRPAWSLVVVVRDGMPAPIIRVEASFARIVIIGIVIVLIIISIVITIVIVKRIILIILSIVVLILSIATSPSGSSSLSALSTSFMSSSSGKHPSSRTLALPHTASSAAGARLSVATLTPGAPKL